MSSVALRGRAAPEISCHDVPRERAIVLNRIGYVGNLEIDWPLGVEGDEGVGGADANHADGGILERGEGSGGSEDNILGKVDGEDSGHRGVDIHQRN